MNRKIAVFVVGLLALGALEFGLLAASAAGFGSGSGPALPPIAQRGVVQATPTAVATATPEPFSPVPAYSIELFQPVPSAIECDGKHASQIHAFLRYSNGSPVNDGTPVTFKVFSGRALPLTVPTGSGGASTSVVLYSDTSQPNVVVTNGALQMAVWLHCKPNSGCPLSPPLNASLPCAPTPFPCNPSPGAGPMSPPCPMETPISPPDDVGGCISFTSPYDCIPSPPQPCDPNVASPPCATATPSPECAPFVPVSPPCAPPTQTPQPTPTPPGNDAQTATATALKTSTPAAASSQVVVTPTATPRPRRR